MEVGTDVDADYSLDAATARDIRAILRLIQEAGWSYTRAEVQRLIDVQPGGLLLLRSRGLRPVLLGCVYASAWGRLGFIGLMLVRGSHRGKGLGREMMMASLEHLHQRGTGPVGLDAVGDAIGFYSSLGFRPTWESLRLSIDTRKTTAPEPGLDVRSADDADVERLIELDRTISRMDRTKILRRLHRDADASLLVVPGEKEVFSFGVLRRSKGCLRLGPLIAPMTDLGSVAAMSIVASAMAETYPRVLTVNVPAYNRSAVDNFQSLGAESHPPCMRMYMGDPGPAGSPEGVWALGAAEKG